MTLNSDGAFAMQIVVLCFIYLFEDAATFLNGKRGTEGGREQTIGVPGGGGGTTRGEKVGSAQGNGKTMPACLPSACLPKQRMGKPWLEAGEQDTLKMT